MPRRRARPGDLRLAVAYLRVSTDKQENGPVAQRNAIEAWALREQVRIAAWHSDDGVSGAKEIHERPALRAAVDQLRPVGAGLLVVAKRDRLARDAMVAGLIDRDVAREGARVISADGAGNGEEPADQFARTLFDAAAAFERGNIRARTKAALAVRKQRGLLTGAPPYGFRAVDDPMGAVTARGKLIRRLEEEPTEQAVIARIVELAQRGASQREIAAVLENDGVRSRAGTPLGQVQVFRILAARRSAAKAPAA